MADISVSEPSSPVTISNSESSAAFASDFVRSWTSGDTVNVVTSMNRNAAVLEHLAFYTCGNGVISGLGLTVVGANVVIAAGEAVIGGLVELVSGVAVTLPTSGNSLYAFLGSEGVITTSATETPPASSLRLGVITNTGAGYVIDTSSYVLKLVNGATWVTIPILGSPSAITTTADYVITADGVYVVTLDGQFLLTSGLTPPTVFENFYLPETYSVNVTEDFTVTGNFMIGGTLNVA